MFNRTTTFARGFAAVGGLALGTAVLGALLPAVPAHADPNTSSTTTTTSAATSSSSDDCPLPGFVAGSRYHPQIDPRDFGPDVDNPWYPLKVGTTYVYTGSKDGEKALDIVVASRRTAVIDGVTTRVVQDRLYLNGVLSERTSDYYAQDRCGNVWYFGEDTAELDANGKVLNTDGSFHAGVDGAQPGVYMQATPHLGRDFRQEWYRGQAQDVFRAVQRHASVRTPYGAFSTALRTEESTALEPAVLDNKYYVAGVGEVVELSVHGPVEVLRLVEIIS